MLDELTELDGISIITPNRTHRPLALQALQAEVNMCFAKSHP